MILGQYNLNNDKIMYVEVSSIEIDKKNIICEVVIDGKKFSRKQINEFANQGFMWFVITDNYQLLNHKDLISDITEWKKNYESKRI